jgi:L-fuculose-phosphate aldolase
VADDPYLKEQVSIGCRVVAREGYADLTLGHVSVFDPDTERVYIKRKGPGLHEIEPEDVLVHPLYDDEALTTTPNMHFEAVLHTEMYKRHPDVGAVIHSHPPYSTAMSATGADLKMVNHDSLLFTDGIARFDEFRLIEKPAEGAEVAEAIGQCRAILLGNHGSVVVGPTIGWAVLAAITLERAIRMQMIAAALGEIREIPLDQAREFAARKYKDAYVDEYWAGWVRTLRTAGPLAPRQVSFG